MRSIFNQVRENFKDLSRETKSLLNLAFTGGLMLILAYPLTFTVRAYAISGRDTRVHAAGAVGVAILTGSLLLLMVALAMKLTRGRAILLGVGIWLAAQASFGFIVQKDYVLAWQLHKRLWTSLVPIVPDADDGTLILVTPDGLQDPRYIVANTWSLRSVFHYLVVFPSDWTSTPKVHRLHSEWKETAAVNGNMLRVMNFAWKPLEIPLGNAILLETEDGKVMHRDEQISIGGVELHQAV